MEYMGVFGAVIFHAEDMMEGQLYMLGRASMVPCNGVLIVACPS